MDYKRLDYITGDRSLHVDFVFMDCDPPIGWRIYIISKIDYGVRNTSSHATHRLHAAGETYNYICWNGRIPTLQEAQAIASLWSDAIALYIRNGGSFDEIVNKLLNK